MKICMLGCGALGSTIGETLAQGGAEVYFVDPWQEHVEAIQKMGLKLTDEKKDWFVLINARTSPQGIGPVDLVIVLVKSFQTKKLLKMSRPPI